MADGAYGADRTLPDGARRLSDTDVKRMGIEPKLMKDDKSGFSASLFYDAPKDRYVLAFEGTNLTSGADWATNAIQGSGLNTSIGAAIGGPNRGDIGQVTNYYVNGEMLSQLQKTTIMADAAGVQRGLPPAKSALPWNLEQHKIGNVVSAIEQRISTLARHAQ